MLKTPQGAILLMYRYSFTFGFASLTMSESRLWTAYKTWLYAELLITLYVYLPIMEDLETRALYLSETFNGRSRNTYTFMQARRSMVYIFY